MILAPNGVFLLQIGSYYLLALAGTQHKYLKKI